MSKVDYGTVEVEVGVVPEKYTTPSESITGIEYW